MVSETDNVKAALPRPATKRGEEIRFNICICSMQPSQAGAYAEQPYRR